MKEKGRHYSLGVRVKYRFWTKYPMPNGEVSQMGVVGEGYIESWKHEKP